jgi:hypothetical protein
MVSQNQAEAAMQENKMNGKVRDMVMSLFFTKSAGSIVVAGLCGLVFMFSVAFSMADDYRWIESDNPEGDQQQMPVDSKICKCYEKNLRYFARRNTPMSCERPIAPCLKNRIKEVEWEDLDPERYPDLFRAIATSGHYSPGTDEAIIERDLKNIRAGIADKVWVFRRAKLSLVGRIQSQAYSAPPEPYWIVQYGPNDISPDNPRKPWRCKPRRGGGGGVESNLELYIVSGARHKLTKQLFSRRVSTMGQHLRIIDNRLFVENIHPDARIELNEVDTAFAWGATICIFEFKKSR